MRRLSTLIVCSITLSINVFALEESIIDIRAQVVARELRPANFETGSAKDLAGMRAQAIKLIEALEHNQRTSHSAPETMISKAYQFRDKEIGKMQAMVAQQSLMQMWKAAASMGLFDKKGKFTNTINRGRGDGETPVFEYIVPPEIAPEYTRFIGNLRLVTPGDQRVKEADLPDRDNAFLNTLKRVKREAETRQRMLDREKSYVEADRRAMSYELYKKAVAEAGDLVNRKPSIIFRGNLTARPSHKSKNRYKVDVNLTNSSRHPTEIQVDIYLIGYTDKNNILYLMKHEKFAEQLRSSENRNYEIWTRNIDTYAKKAGALDTGKLGGSRRSQRRAPTGRVIYRGFIAVATFKDEGIVGYAASDARLLPYASGEKKGLKAFPKF